VGGTLRITHPGNRPAAMVPRAPATAQPAPGFPWLLLAVIAALAVAVVVTVAVRHRGVRHS
jgi:hypothetical protein